MGTQPDETQLKILVAAHKPYWMPNDPCYIPVQVGAAQHAHIEGYAHDDTGDNISSQIIDLLHDTAMTDMAYIYQDAFNSVGYAGRNLIQAKKSDLASWYAKKEKTALKNMQKLIDKYNEM